jgi:3-phosphoshikimate 1-carboxyvinyltransferase
MKTVRIRAQKALAGELSFPGDKSLSHRAIIFGAMAYGDSHFKNVLAGEDCVCTRQAFEQMGVKVHVLEGGTELKIEGVGLDGLKSPSAPLYCGNSGTSMRLLMGLLAGQYAGFTASLTGDPSLSSRPMRRVADPLKRMGARIEGKDDANFAPLKVSGQKLSAQSIDMTIASAQVKSAILLAGLYASGTTKVTEPFLSRDHTENFLRYYGVEVKTKGNTVSMSGRQLLKSKEAVIEIPGDISSAAFFMAIAALVPGTEISFRSLLWNPTRTGVVQVMKRMGVQFEEKVSKDRGPEPVCDTRLKVNTLHGTDILKHELPSLIDEIPILCVLATQATGKTVIHEADELRVKETDRIHSMVTQLQKMGANIHSQGNTITIQGPTPLIGGVVESFKDHRTAMSLIVAGMIAIEETVVRDVECINTSFPSFYRLLDKIGTRYQLVDTP